MKIRLMADYECWPLWWDGGERVGNIDPSGLGLSDDLLRDLMAWASAYDATLNPDNPASSGFASGEDEHRFRIEGERLAARLAYDLAGKAVVRYQA